MAIQNQTYKTRLLAKSALSPQALLVALVIAELRYAKRLAWDEPIALSNDALAKSCHMSRNSAIKYRDECVAAGWVLGRFVYRDGRRRDNEYFICDPTDEAASKRLVAVISRNGQKLLPSVCHISVKRLDGVLRSKNTGVVGDAPLSGGDDNDEQGQIKTAAPDPTRQAESVTANPVATDLQVWQHLDDERQNQQLAELANPPVIPKRRDPLAIGCPEPTCVAAPGEPCPGYKLKGTPHLARRLAVYGHLAVGA